MSLLTLSDFTHLKTTFERNERAFPDLMEPYSIALAEAETDDERTRVMWCGLRETIARRYPLAGEVVGA